MANEITFSAFVNAGRISAVLSELLHENLYDKAGLRGLMQFVPAIAGPSDTQNVTTVTRGYAMTAASSETSSGFTNTALTASQFQLTIARYGLRMQPSDLFRITQPGSPLDIDYVLGILTESLDLTLTDLLTALFPGISGNVGTTTVDMTTDDLYDGAYTLNLALNSGRVVFVGAPKQINDLEDSIRSEPGAVARRSDTQDAVAIGVRRDEMSGFKFNFAGVEVRQSDSVPTANAGADHQGCMFTEGAFAYTLGNVADMDPMVDPDDILAATPEMFIERDRDANNGLTALIVNSYPGTAEAEDARAVKVTTSV